MSIFIDIATDALTAIGQLGTGQSVSPEQAEQALRQGNRLLGKWSVQRLMLYVVNSRSYNLSATTQDYTIGPTGSIGGVATRPTFVESGQLALPGSAQNVPLSILDKPKWDAIGDRGATCSANGLPQSVYVEYSFPNIGLHFWPIPNNAAGLTLGCWEQLTQIATIYDDITWPPGYEDAFMWNLALALCPFYDWPVGEVAPLAAEGLIRVQQINAQGMGGALDETQTLKSPNTGQPQG